METSKDVCTYYTLRGGQDNYVNTIIDMGLREMMRNCLNLIEEETLLQTSACKMVERRDNILVDRTPKYHPEISGEGIE